MKKRANYILPVLFIILIFFAGCEEKDGILNDEGFEAEITTISVEGMLGEPLLDDLIVRAFLTITVGEEEDLSAVSPVIETTQGTTISPASGTTHDFREDKTVTYTITALNGRTKNWIVKVRNFKPPVVEDGFLLTSFEESQNIMTVSWLGGIADQVANPFPGEDNSTDNVIRLSKIDAESYGYTQANALVGMEVSSLDWSLSRGPVFSLLVYNPNDSPAKMTMRLEAGDLRIPTSAFTTLSNGWERVIFDYTDQDLTGVTVEKATWFFDEGNGDLARIFYIDDFRQFEDAPAEQVVVLASFEDGNNIMTVSWLGGVADLLNNPDPSGENTSDNVIRLSKVEASSYGYTQANALIGVEVSNLDFDTANGQKFRLKVYNPNDSPAKMTMRLEYGDTRNSVSAETTKTNEWEELIFDYSAQDLQGITIERLTWFFDEGNDDVSRVFYIDDIAQSK